MAGVFPEITITVFMNDDTEQAATIRASAMVALERKYNISFSDIGTRTEYFMFLAYTQLKHDNVKNLPVFDNWLRRVVNLAIESEEMPSLNEGL